MDTIITTLAAHGGIGMFCAAFLAGTFLPFASEAVLLALLAAGTNPVELLIWGTAGNTLGGLFNYGVGSTKVAPDKLERGKQWVRRYGAWAGLLAWMPVIGSVITVALGFLRVNLLYSLITFATGKFIRYWLIVRAYIAI